MWRNENTRIRFGTSTESDGKRETAPMSIGWKHARILERMDGSVAVEGARSLKGIRWNRLIQISCLNLAMRLGVFSIYDVCGLWTNIP